MKSLSELEAGGLYEYNGMKLSLCSFGHFHQGYLERGDVFIFVERLKASSFYKRFCLSTKFGWSIVQCAKHITEPIFEKIG